MTDKSREAFEAYFSQKVDSRWKRKFSEGSYVNIHAEIAWKAWQASRADLLATLNSDSEVEVAIQSAILNAELEWEESTTPMSKSEYLAKAAIAALIKEIE